MSEITNPDKVDYSDLQANLYRGEKEFTPESNFWNEPFPDTLETVNGNTAYFEKSFNKTHSTLRNRRCALKIELEKANGGTEIIEVGTFLVGGVDHDEDKVQLQLEDLTKKLIEEPADTVKSGFQWYRNIPVKILIEELIKKAYPDPRNGEVPREYLIEGIRPRVPTADPMISSLGKPPGFSRLSTNQEELGICYCLEKGNFNSIGDRLYLGIENQLYEYDELEQTYLNIGTIHPKNGASTEKFNIKKLWFNSTENYLYGVAWPLEELIHTNDLEPQKKFSLPVASDFIFFRANRDGIETLFDSTNENVNNLSTSPKLFSGEYHIVHPYLQIKYVTAEEWEANNGDIGNYFPTTILASGSNWYTNDAAKWWANNVFRPSILQNNTSWGGFYGNPGHYEMYSGFGYLDDLGGSYPRKTIYNGSHTYWGTCKNLPIPFTQKIGFALNFNQDVVAPTWIEGLHEDTYENYFGLMVSLPVLGEYRQNPVFRQHARPKFFIRSAKSLLDPFYRFYKTDTRTNFIVGIRNIPNFVNYETDEVFDGYLPSIPYEEVTPAYEHLPYANTIGHNFDPGYLSYYGEHVLKMQAVEPDLSNAPIPFLKYTSGQKGTVEYIPTYGTKGGIFFQAFHKQNFYSSNKLDYRWKVSDGSDLDITGSSYDINATVKDLYLDCWIYDIGTNTFYKLTNLDSANFKRTTPSSKTYPKQITSVAVDAGSSIVYLYSTTFPNKADWTNRASEDERTIISYINRVVLTGGAGTTITQIDSRYNEIFTDSIFVRNSSNVLSLIGASYDLTKILANDTFLERPSIGKCFKLFRHNATPGTTQNILTDNLYQFRHLIKSPTVQGFYCTEIENRDEQTGGVMLRKLLYDDSFILTNSTSQTSKLGYVNDAIYGESNNLSNLEVINFDAGFDTIFGISDGYYENPINRATQKNHLWKYDSFLSGVIELADLSQLSVWEAITQIAYAFNYVTGFSNDIFFFLPKALESSPSIILDLDNDGVLKGKKQQDVKVSNIIRATPYRVIKGDIEWAATTVPNETDTANDLDRVQLNMDVRIEQRDDFQKKIYLRTKTRGYIPENYEGSDPNGYSALRFSYLIVNNVIETKLSRDLTSGSTKLIIPTLFGQELTDHVKAGDIFVIDYTDEETGESIFISRIIKYIDYTYNEIELDAAVDKSFPAFTPVKIYRAFHSEDDTLRNNSWSDTGVTIIKSDNLTNEGQSEGKQAIGISVASIRNLSVHNLVQLGNWAGEYKIIEVTEGTLNTYPKITVIPFRSAPSIGPDQYPELNGAIIKATIYPFYGELVEIGGTKVFFGFAPGSSGTFWVNSKGQDRIDITCNGLLLEPDNQAIVTAVDVDSIAKYGKQTENIENNRFIQTMLAEYQARAILHWKAQPRLVFDIDNIIQARDNGGSTYIIPSFKLINTSEKKLFSVRVISRRFLPRFEGYACDCYIIDHSFNLKSFTQALSLRSLRPY